MAEEKKKNTSSGKVAICKKNMSILQKLYLSCSIRGDMLKIFFEHEVGDYPTSLAIQGDMRPASKSTLLPILESHCEVNIGVYMPFVNYLFVIDGPHVKSW